MMFTAVLGIWYFLVSFQCLSSPLQKKCSQSLCGVSREFSYCSCKKKLKALKHPLLGIYNPSAKDIGSIIGKREISCKKGKGKLRSSWKKGRLKTVVLSPCAHSTNIQLCVLLPGNVLGRLCPSCLVCLFVMEIEDTIQ